jgi:CBS domain containing-hemolysin-like protein
MSTWTTDVVNIIFAIILVFINGFFVAAEFALVKIRPSRLDEQVAQNRPFAETARWLTQRMDAALSACQLGITMASLGLGWIGEPAIATCCGRCCRQPALFPRFGYMVSPLWWHLLPSQPLILFSVSRHPRYSPCDDRKRFCFALPMKFFYFLSYPFMMALNATTSFLLQSIGVEGVSEHDTVHSEDEIKALLRLAHKHGELSRSEHRLINAVFEFDDTVCRRIIQPRSDIIFFDITRPYSESIILAKEAKHSRYPLCEGSLDNVLGVVHIKDLIGVSPDKESVLRSIARPAQFVPETLRISRLLRQFQETHQHMAFVVDEYGTVIGCATLEDVLERIVGPVDDEFDTNLPDFEPDGPGRFIITGGTSITAVNRQLKLQLTSVEAETLSGLLVEKTGQVPKIGVQIELEGAVAEVLDIKGSRASRIRMELKRSSSKEI